MASLVGAVIALVAASLVGVARGDASSAARGGSFASVDEPSSGGAPPPPLALVWSAPFFSGGGYCSEATAFVRALDAHAPSVPLAIQQHGDGFSTEYAFALPEEAYDALQRLGRARPPPGRGVISVCHSEPGAWAVSRDLPQLYQTSFCPLVGAAVTVGRTMFESDRAPAGWADRLNGMDEVWVPTDFQAGVFAAAGVERAKLVVLPEPVDTDEFAPMPAAAAAAAADADARAWAAAARAVAESGGADDPLGLFAPPGAVVGGRAPSAAAVFDDGAGGGADGGARPRARLLPPRACVRVAPPAGSAATGAELPTAAGADRHIAHGSTPGCPFRFLMVGKWERRKGFDLALRAAYVAFGLTAGTPEEEDAVARAQLAGDAPAVDVSLVEDAAPASDGAGGEPPGGGGGGAAASRARPHVELVVLTSAYHSSSDLRSALESLIADELACGAPRAPSLAGAAAVGSGEPLRPGSFLGPPSFCVPPPSAGGRGGEGRGLLPRVRLLHAVPQGALPSLYHEVDALLQPSRGEGWGRPHVEAMASGLPVLATAWAGPAAYIDERNGYPVPPAFLLPVPDGAFAGHLMAEADVPALARAMRRVVARPAEAAARGAAARSDMLERFALPVVAAQVEGHVRRLSARVAAAAAAAAARAAHEGGDAAKEAAAAAAVGARRAAARAAREAAEAAADKGAAAAAREPDEAAADAVTETAAEL